MGKNPDVIEATHMVLHLMKAGMAIYGYPAVAIHRGMVQKNGELFINKSDFQDRICAIRVSGAKSELCGHSAFLLI